MQPRDVQTYAYLIHVCIWFCYVRSPTITHNGFHKGGRAAKRHADLCGGGRRPPPLWVLVFVYFVLLGNIFVLFGHLLTLLPYQQSRTSHGLSRLDFFFEKRPFLLQAMAFLAWIFFRNTTLFVKKNHRHAPPWFF